MILKCIMVVCGVALFFCNSQVFAADSYSVNAGQTVNIDEFGVCKDVTNTLGVGIMVPTKTANEWHTGGSSFLENLYAGVLAANCPPLCGGVLVGGYCWYLSSSESSCTSACSAYGGVNIAGTRNYAGSGGSSANCTLVLNSLGRVNLGPGVSLLDDDNKGCFDDVGGDGDYSRGEEITTASSFADGARRACACNS